MASSHWTVFLYKGLLVLFFAVFHVTASFCQEAPELQLTPEEDARLDKFLLHIDRAGLTAAIPRGAMNAADDVSNPVPSGSSSFPGDVEFPTDPTDPLPYDPGMGGDMFPFPTVTKSGSSEKLALEVMFQTFMFYGVAHIIEKNGSQVNFKIVRSKYNYFMNVTKLDIAYAIREFARYFNAHLCGQPTMENFYRAFAQVPAEEIGLRFKYDMAWAILGNSLPREPNQIMKLGTRWKALDQILSTTSVLKPQPGESGSQQSSIKDLRVWTSTLRDIVNTLTRLNKLLCYVDIRPNPKDELKKRVVIGKMLELDRNFTTRYAEFKDILDQANKQGKADQIQNLRGPTK